MSTPEPRFEVPPEYAEVYERAYRRAYEEVQASLGTSPGEAPLNDAVDAVDAADPPDVESPGGAAVQRDPSGSGHRADRSRGPGRRSLLLAVAVALALVPVVAFVVGRLTADSTPVQAHVQAQAGTKQPGTKQPGTKQAGTNRATGSRYPYAMVPATVRDVTTTCTAVSGQTARSTTAYDVHNVLDDRPGTAWRCDRLAIGQELTFTLAPGTRVVQVGLVPGYARGAPGSSADRYARNDRITRVAWYLGNGTVVQEAMSADPENRSLRTTIVPPTSTGEVRLRILRISQGAENTTAISTVQILAAR